MARSKWTKEYDSKELEGWRRSEGSGGLEEFFFIKGVGLVGGVIELWHNSEFDPEAPWEGYSAWVSLSGDQINPEYSQVGFSSIRAAKGWVRSIVNRIHKWK